MNKAPTRVGLSSSYTNLTGILYEAKGRTLLKTLNSQFSTEIMLIECVPNISEGKNPNTINAIAKAIQSVNGVKVLHIDSGQAANRTVITFAGPPDAVVEAAFLMYKKAFELIDMQTQTGAHPRIGAVDVCPLIPISGIELKEVDAYAKKLGQKIASELNISGYHYEASASNEVRKNLAHCRKGEYEGIENKINNPHWKTDFGPGIFDATIKKFGLTVLGARNFLVAFNVNLKSKSVAIAKDIAAEIRASGKKVKNRGTIPGKLKAVKAIGWYIEEFGIAQVSYNIIDFNCTPIHIVFEETVKAAKAKNVEVNGSELIGLIPLKAMLDAGTFYAAKNNMTAHLNDTKKISLAIEYLGLNTLNPFDPNKRILEYALLK